MAKKKARNVQTKIKNTPTKKKLISKLKTKKINID